LRKVIVDIRGCRVLGDGLFEAGDGLGEFEVVKVVEALLDEILRGEAESGQEQKDGKRPH
jgi:hypothetical protein